jgi:hypothetical protein
MLILRKDMLLPEGTLDSLVDFMDEARDVGDNAGYSKYRYTIITTVNDVMHYNEGYLCYHTTGEVRIRSNTIAYTRQLHLYAWDSVVALVPSNKTVKKFWLHPDMENMLPKLDFHTHYYRLYYKERIEECLKISQLT